MFTVGEMRRCTATNISISMDTIVESVETFNIRISSNDVPISPISTIATRVNIGDLSRKSMLNASCLHDLDSVVAS